MQVFLWENQGNYLSLAFTEYSILSYPRVSYRNVKKISMVMKEARWETNGLFVKFTTLGEFGEFAKYGEFDKFYILR
jgi:hypothetical protein